MTFIQDQGFTYKHLRMLAFKIFTSVMPQLKLVSQVMMNY